MFFGRGKNKYSNSYTFKDMYNEYIKDKGSNGPYYVSYNTYVQICSKYWKKAAESIIEGDSVRLGYRLGEIKVVKLKLNISQKKLPIDWVNTVKYGKVIYHLNEHTNGYTYKIYWNKKNCNVKYLYCYGFKMTRIKRDICKLVKDKQIDYFEKD